MKKPENQLFAVQADALRAADEVFEQMSKMLQTRQPRYNGPLALFFYAIFFGSLVRSIRLSMRLNAAGARAAGAPDEIVDRTLEVYERECNLQPQKPEDIHLKQI